MDNSCMPSLDPPISRANRRVWAAESRKLRPLFLLWVVGRLCRPGNSLPKITAEARRFG